MVKLFQVIHMGNKTIVGQATANGISALHLIRVSGDDAFSVVGKIFNGPSLDKALHHSVIYGHIEENGEIIDEVMVFVYRAPNTYTRENMVEISCHGGFLAVSEIIRLLVKSGADLAKKGEFTKRAFLNGRIDLTEAESVMDIVNAKTRSQLVLAEKTLGGEIKSLIAGLQSDLLNIIAKIAVNIDYPEYDDIEILTNETLVPEISALKTKIDKIISQSKTGKIIREGVSVVIAGKPNVGKSSLMNSLLKEEKAIVTDISGTTRDLIDAEMNIDGILVRLTDTAGIRESSDTVEKIGIDRAKKAVSDADLVLLVLDNSESLTDYDRALLTLTEKKPRIIVGNKSDIGKKINLDSERVISTSAKNKSGMDELTAAIYNTFVSAKTDLGDAMLANSRHIGKLEEAGESLTSALKAAKSRLPVDMIEIDLRESWSHLGEITGDSAAESLVDRLFSSFCLGK